MVPTSGCLEVFQNLVTTLDQEESFLTSIFQSLSPAARNRILEHRSFPNWGTSETKRNFRLCLINDSKIPENSSKPKKALKTSLPTYIAKLNIIENKY